MSDRATDEASQEEPCARMDAHDHDGVPCVTAPSDSCVDELRALRNLRDEVIGFLSAASWREIHPGYRALQCTVEPQHRDGLRAALSAVQSVAGT